MSKIAPIDVDSETTHPMLRGFATQVKNAFLDIAQSLLSLSPLDNFSGFLYEGTIDAATEVKIVNRSKKVPTGYIVVFNQGGSIEAGTTDWTKDFVYLENPGASAVNVKVFFFL